MSVSAPVKKAASQKWHRREHAWAAPSNEFIPAVQARWLSPTLASKSCTVSSPVESIMPTSELLQFKASFCGFGLTVYLVSKTGFTHVGRPF